MSSKKESTIQLSPEEITQTEDLFSQYPSIAEQLHTSQDQAQIEAALTPIINLSEAAQFALIKTLAKANRSEAADILVALNAFSSQKEVRKEARRGLLRLEGAKTRPHWTAPAAPAPAAVQLATANPPRFLSGLVTQSRDAGEIQLLLSWEQGYEYSETRLLHFLLNFWQNGLQGFRIVGGTKRSLEKELQALRSELDDSELVPCTLAEGKRLIEEALDINHWRDIPPADDYRTYLPQINKLIFQASDIDVDSGQSFITPALEEQEVAVNFLGAWSFGDFGLAYDLLATNNSLRDNLSRDEWIQEHRAWFVEAHPARLQLKFVHEKEAGQSALWLPTSTMSQLSSTKKELEVGWALELIDTPLSGTLKEMPMATAVNKETGRHWFWTNFTLVKEHDVWRIQQLQDEGVALQALSDTELQKRIADYTQAIEESAKQKDQNPEDFAEEMSWRLTQILHFADARIALLPLDMSVNEDAYDHAILTGDPERIVVYLERLAQRFPQNRADTLRRLGSTLVDWAYRYDDPQDKERRQHLLDCAEATLREASSIDNTALSHTLLAEFLVSIDNNAEARAELLTSQQLLPKQDADPDLVSTIEAGLGNVAMRQENIDEAILHFKRVIDSNPAYPGINFNLGFAQRLLGHISEAETYYLQALQTEPEDFRLYSELTAIYMQRADLAKAQTLLEEALGHYAQAGYLHALMASVLSEKGDKRQALHHLKEAERLDPDSPLTDAVRQQVTDGRKRA
jgi:tetratricopeptide (TPR) repeat protein